ncbi:MAG: hypothetical protein KGL01_08795 [Betaproteobacteria bacterium]|nr:hypothetical protein [Betaproteobacteria bacterium]
MLQNYFEGRGGLWKMKKARQTRKVSRWQHPQHATQGECEMKKTKITASCGNVFLDIAFPPDEASNGRTVQQNPRQAMDASRQGAWQC